VSVAAPLHGLEELELDAAGVDTGPETGEDGEEIGVDGVATLPPAAPPDVYVASNPPASTELSAENWMYMVPDVAVTDPGVLLPLNDPS
jgi:hypothetical protein